MALIQQRRIDKIEVVYPIPGDPASVSLQVRYIDDIVDDVSGEVIAVKGFHREAFDTSGDLKGAPVQIQAAASAMAAFRQAHPDTDAVVSEQR